MIFQPSNHQLGCKSSLRRWFHDPGLLEWNFKLSRFHPKITWGNQFSTWYLFRLVYIFFLIFLHKYVSNYFLIPLTRGETIAQGNYFLAKRDPGSTKEGSRLGGRKLFPCNLRIYEEFITWPGSWQNGIEFHLG